MKKDKVKLIDWKVDGGMIVFFEAQGGRALAQVDVERCGLLMNGNYVRGLLEEEAQELRFPAAWGLREYVEIVRLLQKGLDQETIAKLWGASPAALRSFYSAAIQKFQHAQDAVRQERERQATSETEKDYCQSLKRAETRPGEEGGPAQVFLEVPKTAAILAKEGPGGTAVKMELDFADLQDWIEKNKRYLTLFGYKDNLF